MGWWVGGREMRLGWGGSVSCLGICILGRVGSRQVMGGFNMCVIVMAVEYRNCLGVWDGFLGG